MNVENINLKIKRVYVLTLFILINNLFSTVVPFIDNKFSSPRYSQILPNVNSNCIWVGKEDILDSSSVDLVLEYAINHNVNKLFYQSRYLGDAFYNSNIVPKSEALDSIFDPLSYIIKKTDTLNIEIHAWFNTYLLWKGDDIPYSDSHLFYRCPECLEADFNGKSDADININENQSKNWEGMYLSPLHPRVNNHLLNVINELINNYQIDGVHLDYLRYQDDFYGYNKVGLKNFIDNYGVDPRDINRGILSTRFGYSEEYVDSVTSLWENYKINKITELVRSVKYKTLNDSLNIQISAAVKPNFKEAKYRWYQDWMSWIDEDLVDFVVIKNYNNLEKFNLYNKLITNQLIHSDQRDKIYIGISLYDLDLLTAANQILLSRLQGYENFCIYTNIGTEVIHYHDTFNPVLNILNLNLNEKKY